MTAAGSCGTVVVYYLSWWTDDGCTGDDWMLNAKQVEYQLDDDGPMDEATKDGRWAGCEMDR